MCYLSDLTAGHTRAVPRRTQRGKAASSTPDSISGGSYKQGLGFSASTSFLGPGGQCPNSSRLPSPGSLNGEASFSRPPLRPCLYVSQKPHSQPAALVKVFSPEGLSICQSCHSPYLSSRVSGSIKRQEVCVWGSRSAWRLPCLRCMPSGPHYWGPWRK